MKKVLTSSLFRTSIVTLLFALSYIFYNLELVRGNVEDTAFDAIDKFVIAKKEQNLTSPKVMLFAIDDTYLKTNKLLDEDNETNYGFYLPNDKIAEFIDNLDEFVEEVEPSNMPKVLFIDFDFKSLFKMRFSKLLGTKKEATGIKETLNSRVCSKPSLRREFTKTRKS